MFVCSSSIRQLLFSLRSNGGVLRLSTKVSSAFQLNPTERNGLDDEKHVGSFEHFSISDETQRRLRARGVEYLFPVQSRSFKEIFSGNDSIVQARTGTGKTLAFTLPIVERLQRDLVTERGRSPRCLVLEPTRELAKQVTDDFLSIKNRLLSISTLYGGKDYAGQESSLRQGSDVVVGTPGRIKDFLLRKKLLLHRCEILVLDEVDRMLDMGFQDDVDAIIRQVSNGEKTRQMIVFSATIPSWLKTSVSRYMSSEKISFINLIEDSQEKTAKNVEHLCVKLNDVRQRAPLVLSLFEKYSSEGQAIVFCQTKHECDLLVRSNQINSYPSAVLHGDLSQNKREQVLKAFRHGDIRLLITTDISARGLDIPQIDLVILTSPPQDWESYVHRSGRTGRAGKLGKAICIYTDEQIRQLKTVQQRANIQFLNIDIKSPSDTPNLVRQRRMSH